MSAQIRISISDDKPEENLTQRQLKWQFAKHSVQFIWIMTKIGAYLWAFYTIADVIELVAGHNVGFAFCILVILQQINQNRLEEWMKRNDICPPK